MFKLFFFIISSALVFLITIYFRLGGNKPVEITYEEYPAVQFIYKTHLGPYHKINEDIEEVEHWAAQNNIPCTQTLGEYLVDPRTTEERYLKSYAGCLVHFKPQNMGLYEYKNYEKKKWVIAKFDGAPSISPFIVYPKVEKFISEHSLKMNGSTIEIYSILEEHKAHTVYLFNVSPIQP
ncbi:MAG: GyrI-like domain-containing protein [Bdellovibrionales bacterium]